MTRLVLLCAMYLGLLVGGTWVLEATANVPPPASATVPVASVW